MAPSFSLAAVRVVERFYSMYPTAGFTRVDVTGVKARWYARKVAHVKRETLGKQAQKEVA